VLDRPDQHPGGDGEGGRQQAADHQQRPPADGHRPVSARQRGREVQLLPRPRSSRHPARGRSFCGHDSSLPRGTDSPHGGYRHLPTSHADAEWVSSALLRIELTRAVARAVPALLPEARDLLTAFSYIAIDDEIVDGAMGEPDRGLRSLDAIHLATARILAPELEGLVTYDDRLIKAAPDAGLATVSPGTETA